MMRNASHIRSIAQAGFAQAQLEERWTEAGQRRTVHEQAESGSDNCDALFALPQSFRLVFVRCHFLGEAGTAPMHITLASRHGPQFDTRLFAITKAGTDHDVHVRFDNAATNEPSAWSFAAGDAIRITWNAPDDIHATWGLQVGLAPATEYTP